MSTPHPDAPVVELRHTPVQARSQKRLDELKAAALVALADPHIGRDRITTADVARIAGASIGTVYRYFPDRVAVLNAVFPERDQSLPEQVKAA